MSDISLTIIEKKRKEIDKIDEKIVKLLIERLDSAKEISLQKRSLGKDNYDPAREQIILEKIGCICNSENAEDKGDFIIGIYSELLKQSKLYQAIESYDSQK